MAQVLLCTTSMLRSAAVAALFLVACAPVAAEEMGSSDSNLSGNAIEEDIVTTTTDGLRLRKTPNKDDQSNVIGLLPTGTRLKILKGEPTDGFYNVEVMSEDIRDALLVPKGWVFGEYLEGRTVDPGEDPPSLTGARDVPTVARVKWRAEPNCRTLLDDEGKAMTPTLDQARIEGAAFAVLGIDTNTFSYGMRASIEEIDKRSTFNITGTPIPFKIVKTARTAPDGPFTVTLCMPGAHGLVLPDDEENMLTLRVYPN